MKTFKMKTVKKRTAAFITAAFTALTASGCGGSGKTDTIDTQIPAEAPAVLGGSTALAGSTRTLSDMIGREVAVTPGSYKRVVCIGAGALRMYSYIGDVSLLCGVEDIDNESLENRPQMFDSSARPYVLAYSEVFKALPSCGAGGPNAQTAEAEKILSCNPDIVISEYEDADKENALQEQLGVPVITLRTGSDGVFGDAFDGSMALLGEVFAREERADEIISYVDRQADELSARTSSVPEEERPAVYICGLGNWGTTNHLFTSAKYLPFNVVNIRNAVTGLAFEGVGQIEEEKFAAAGGDTDIMIVDAAAVKNIAPLYREDSAIFDACKAWNEGEVYLQMAYNAYYTNYEIALANAWFMGKTVYPDKFGDIDMTAKTDEITEMFLGLPLAEEIFSRPGSFGGYGRIDTKTFFSEE